MHLIGIGRVTVLGGSPLLRVLVAQSKLPEGNLGLTANHTQDNLLLGTCRDDPQAEIQDK